MFLHYFTRLCYTHYIWLIIPYILYTHFGFADNSPSIVILTDGIPVIAYQLLHLLMSSQLFSIGSLLQRNRNNFY